MKFEIWNSSKEFISVIKFSTGILDKTYHVIKCLINNYLIKNRNGGR